MKIERVETFQADAGWRMFSFLKVTTDDGIAGWSEFNESFGSLGLSDVIGAVVCDLHESVTEPVEHSINLHLFRASVLDGEFFVFPQPEENSRFRRHSWILADLPERCQLPLGPLTLCGRA